MLSLVFDRRIWTVQSYQHLAAVYIKKVQGIKSREKSQGYVSNNTVAADLMKKGTVL